MENKNLLPREVSEIFLAEIGGSIKTTSINFLKK